MASEPYSLLKNLGCGLSNLNIFYYTFCLSQKPCNISLFTFSILSSKEVPVS
nr:MAG TPA: hypothetical protein [Caudoviricetes sp.]